MDENLLKEALALGISTVNKTADELRAEIEERRKQPGNSNSAKDDPIVDELAKRYLQNLNEAAEARPRTAKEKREAREANPVFYAFSEGEMSKADRDKLQKSAEAAGMSVEAYSELSRLGRFKADQVGPQRQAAERKAKQEDSEIDPYAVVSADNAAIKEQRGELNNQLSAEAAIIRKGENRKASGMLYDALSPEAMAGALAQKRSDTIEKELSGLNYKAADVLSPFEEKRALRRQNEETRKEMEAEGASPEAIQAAMKSETEMSDAAQQRWKDLTTKGTVEDRRAYWTAAADRMKAEGRSVGTVTRMETPDGEVIAEREPNNGRMQWADGSVGGPADMSNPAFARSLETAQRGDEVPQKANVPVVNSGAGNNDPVVDALTGKQEMAVAPRPKVIEGEQGRAVSGIYGTGRTGGAKFTPEQEAEIEAARNPEGFAQTANGPVALKKDPLVAAQEQAKKEAEKKKIEEELKRRSNGLA
jgi:hypothetical protein